MNHLERLREALPVLAALYAVMMAAHLHAAPYPTLPAARFDAQQVISHLEWHMLAVARNERSEAILFPRN